MAGRERIHVVAILGTGRPGNYTGKALALVRDELEATDDCSCELFDVGTLELPFPGQPETADAKRLQEAVGGASGVIIATPEYHGSFASQTKLVIENLGFPSALGGKPVALLGVAGGRIGAIKSLEALRGVCSHVGAIVLPGAVSVANVRSIFDEDGRCNDEATEKQVRGVARRLIDYVQQHICPSIALEQMVRGS